MLKEKRCLLVEDDPDDQEFFMEVLHRVASNTGCYAVSNGEEALFTLLKEDFMPDYIFTDLNMPRMGGFEFLKILRSIEKFRAIPVIVFSSDCSEENIKQAKQLGANAIYSKTRFGILPEILKKYLADSPSYRSVL